MESSDVRIVQGLTEYAILSLSFTSEDTGGFVMCWGVWSTALHGKRAKLVIYEDQVNDSEDISSRQSFYKNVE